MTQVKNRLKLEALKVFLDSNGVSYIEDYKSGLGVVIDLKIPKFHIAVKLGYDAEFYNKVLKRYKPFFIRDNETIEFVIEKMQTCMVDIMILRQRRMEKKARREENLKAEEEARKRKEERRRAHEAQCKAREERRKAVEEQPVKKRRRRIGEMR